MSSADLPLAAAAPAPAPAPASSSTQPGPGPSTSNKRHYVSQACVNCRSRRVRCSGEQPCANCTRRESVCVFEKDRRKGNTPQQQIDRLRQENQRLRDIISSHGIGEKQEVEGSQDSESDDEIGRDQDTPASGEGQSKRRKTAPSTLPAQHTGGFINDRRSGEVVHYGSTGFHTILDETVDGGTIPSHEGVLGIYGLPTHVVTFETVTPALHAELLAYYFTYLNNSTPFIDQDSFVSAQTSGIRSPIYSHFLHLAILAVAAHLCKRPELRSVPDDCSTAGIGFLLEAMGMIESEIDNPRPTTALGLTLLASATADRGQDSLSWIYAGMAVRIVQHLGLHVPSSEAGVDEDVRASVLWSIFCNDKLVCTYTGRSCALQTEDIAVPLPMTSSHLAGPGNSGPTAQTIIFECSHAFTGLAAVAGHILQTLYGVRSKSTPLSAQAFARLEASLAAWAISLPRDLQDGPTGIRSQMPCVLLMHTTYRCVQLLLHRPFWRRFSGSADRAKLTCLEAATRIGDLVSLYDALIGMDKASITFTHNLYTAATTLLLLYVDEEGSQQRATIATAYRKVVRGLVTLSSSWRIPLSALITIDFLARSCLTDAAQGAEHHPILAETAEVAREARSKAERPVQNPQGSFDLNLFLDVHDGSFFMPEVSAAALNAP